MSNGSDMEEGILFAGAAKCNQELDCGPRLRGRKGTNNEGWSKKGNKNDDKTQDRDT